MSVQHATMDGYMKVPSDDEEYQAMVTAYVKKKQARRTELKKYTDFELAARRIIDREEYFRDLFKELGLNQNGDFLDKLKIAVIRGDLEMTNEILKAQHQDCLSSLDRETSILLAIAALSRAVEPARRVLDYRAEMLELLFKKGLRPVGQVAHNMRGNILHMFFERYCEKSDWDLVDVARVIVDSGAVPDFKEASNYGFTTGLHKAVMLKSPELIRFFIEEKGMDVDSKSGSDKTVLTYAVFMRADLKIVELLVSMGADVNARSKTGWTPLGAAKENDDDVVMDFLIKHGATDLGNYKDKVPEVCRCKNSVKK